MTTATLKLITGVSVTASTVQLLYTVPALTTSTLIGVLVMNQDAAVTGLYQIWHVPASPGTAPTLATDQLANKFVLDQDLLPKERQSISDREVMNAGDRLYIFCTTAVTARGSVLEQA